MNDASEDGNYFIINAGFDINIFAKGGDSVNVVIDCRNKTAVISGSNKSLNEYINATQDRYAKIKKQIDDRKLNEGDFKTFDLFTDSAFRTFTVPDTAPEYFREYEAIRANYYKAMLYYWYPFNHSLAKREKYSWPADFKEKAPMISFDDSCLISIEEYRNFLNCYLDMKAKYIAETGKLPYTDYYFTNAKLDIARNEFISPRIRNFALQNIMKDHFKEFGYYLADGIVSTFDKDCSDSTYRKEIDSLYRTAKKKNDDHIVEVYKKTKQCDLNAHVFLPADSKKKHPTIICYYGGGWYQGCPEQYFEFCRFFAKNGFVAVSVDYRSKGRFNSTPMEGLYDAKSAVRWLRGKAKEWNIDLKKVATTGWSAGGHLAGCTALIQGFNEPVEDTSVSAYPNAVIMNVPCFKTEGENWFSYCANYSFKPEILSPVCNVRKGMPPMLGLLGTKDQYNSVESGLEFEKKMKEKKNPYTFMLKEGADHFTFRDEYYAGVMLEWLKKNLH